MNISSVRYDVPRQNNITVRKTSKDVAFGWRGSMAAENAKMGAGCAGAGLLLILFSPFVLLEYILSQRKEEKINLLTRRISSEYTEPSWCCPSDAPFREDVDALNSLLDKYAIKTQYSDFVKDATEFLGKYFELALGHKRFSLDAFDNAKHNNNDISGVVGFNFFMNIINRAAKVSISKNGKNIDIEQLDKDIQWARDIMQQNKV